MNTLRITSIPLASLAFGIDLSHGTPHQFIGFGAMALATWMLLSTDFLLSLYLKPGGTAATLPDQSESLVAANEGLAKTSSTADSAGVFRIPAVRWLLFAGLAGLSVIQLIDLQKKSFRLIGGNIFLDLKNVDLPREIHGWQKVDYLQESRTTDADFGERSDFWRYQRGNRVATFSLDQTFRMWHDLTVCYRNSGWKLDREEVVYGKDQNWPTVYAEFSQKDGRFAILLYGLFDRAKLPLEVPGHLDVVSSVLKRIQKRLSYSAGELFREQTCYQVQVFMETDRDDIENRSQACHGTAGIQPGSRS